MAGFVSLAPPCHLERKGDKLLAANGNSGKVVPHESQCARSSTEAFPPI